VVLRYMNAYTDNMYEALFFVLLLPAISGSNGSYYPIFVPEILLSHEFKGGNAEIGYGRGLTPSYHDAIDQKSSPQGMMECTKDGACALLRVQIS